MPVLMSGAPRTQIKEATLAGTVNTSTEYGSIVFGSPRGRSEPVFCSSWAQWISNFGGSLLDWGFAGISAKAYLNNGPGIWSYRVSSDSYYATSFIVFDSSANAAPSISYVYVNTSDLFASNAEAATGFSIKPASQSYSAGTVTIDLTLSGVVNSTYTISASMSSATDSYSWLKQIVQSINTTLNADSNVSSLFPNGALGYGETANGNLFIYFAQGLSATATTSSSSEIEIVYDPFIQVIARDASGTYANNYYGNSVSSFSTGAAQVSNIYFSNDLEEGQTVKLQFTVGANNYIVTQAYSSSSSSTITALAAAISALSISGFSLTATASSYSGGTDINYITITASIAGKGIYQIAQLDTLTNYSILTSAAGKNDPQTFTFSTWNISNTTTALESYVVSLTDRLDANGNQLNITTVLEGGNSSDAASSYVRAYVGNTSVSNAQPSYNGLIAPNAATSTILWLNGGDDGALPSNGAIAEGWSIFGDTETYAINLLINGGYTDPSIQVAMANVADNRMDAIAVLDLPRTYVTAQTAADYRNSSINTVSTRAALYTPYLKTVDPTTYKNVWAPPSGFAADRFVYTRNNYGNYYSPAGTTYGVVANVTDVEVNYSDLGDRDILDAAQINYIRKMNGAIVIDNDRTMVDNDGMLSSLNVRIMVNDLERSAAILADTYKFSLDNPITMSAIEKSLQAEVDVYTNAGALSAGVVVCSLVNNTAVYQDNAQININIYLIPVRATRYLYVGVGIGTNTIGISELESSGIV